MKSHASYNYDAKIRNPSLRSIGKSFFRRLKKRFHIVSTIADNEFVHHHDGQRREYAVGFAGFQSGPGEGLFRGTFHKTLPQISSEQRQIQT